MRQIAIVACVALLTLIGCGGEGDRCEQVGEVSVCFVEGTGLIGCEADGESSLLCTSPKPAQQTSPESCEASLAADVPGDGDAVGGAVYPPGSPCVFCALCPAATTCTKCLERQAL